MDIEIISPEEFKVQVEEKGVSIIGAADYTEIENIPTYDCGSKDQKFPKAISIGVRLSDEIMNGIINVVIS